MQDLGTLGGTTSFGRAINDKGQVTGLSTRPAKRRPHAFLWNGSAMQDLGTLGGNFSQGRAINNKGQVTGYATTAGNETPTPSCGTAARCRTSARWAARSVGTAINDKGQVTGQSTTGVEPHAFLWDGSAMQDLNDLIQPLPPNVTLTDGLAINDRGQILANGCDSRTGDCRAYLVSPVVDQPGDGDGDGIADSIDTAPVTPSEAFNDVGDATSGSITDRAGLTVTIDDAASPDGVRVQVGTGSGHITLDACGFTETVDAASELIITCGSVKLHVIQGAAQVVLDGGTVVSIPAGVTASVTDNGNGSFQVQNLGGGNVTITANGVPTTIGPGQSQTVSGQSLTALSSAHGWIGLKSSDDQGTPFDLRVELLKNGVPVANGLTRCITGVTPKRRTGDRSLGPLGCVRAGVHEHR